MADRGCVIPNKVRTLAKILPHRKLSVFLFKKLGFYWVSRDIQQYLYLTPLFHYPMFGITLSYTDILVGSLVLYLIN
jgi:hypothetical protein